MIDKTYSIFQVHNYKGGELSSEINMSKEKFINELCELFENVEVNDTSTVENVEACIIKCLNDSEFYSEYAGGGGFVGELYEIENNEMKEVCFNDFTKDIAIQLLEYYK